MKPVSNVLELIISKHIQDFWMVQRAAETEAYEFVTAPIGSAVTFSSSAQQSRKADEGGQHLR